MRRLLSIAFILFCLPAIAQISTSSGGISYIPGGSVTSAGLDSVFGISGTQNNALSILRNPSGSYQPQNTYCFNCDPAYLPHLQMAVSKVSGGTGNAIIAYESDSLGFGIGDDGTTSGGNYPPLSEPAQLADILTSTYNLNASWQSWFGTATNGEPSYLNNDTRLSFGTWVRNTGGTTFGGDYIVSQSTNSATAFTPTAQIDTCTVYYSTYVGSGTITLDVSGAGTQTVSTSAANGTASATATGTLGTNTCNVKLSSGGNVNVAGMIARNSGKSEVSIVNMGAPGATTADWVSWLSGNVFSQLTTLQPDAAIIKLGTNVWDNGVPVATFTSQLQSLITLHKNAGIDVILETPIPCNPSNCPPVNPSTAVQQQYIAAMYGLSYLNNVPLIDNFNKFQSYTVSQPYYADTYAHLLAKGYNYLARSDASALANVIGFGSLVAPSGGGGGTPGSPSTSVQYNNAGTFAGSSNFTYNNSTGELNVTANVNGGFNLASSNAGGTGIFMNNTSSGAHNWGFFITGSSTPGFFGAFDSVQNITPFAVWGTDNIVLTDQNGTFGFSTSTSNAANGGCDTGMFRKSAGVIEASNCFSTEGSFRSLSHVFDGSSSGTTTLQSAAAASGTLTLPAATDTLVGKATTDTLTNKTYGFTAGNGLIPFVASNLLTSNSDLFWDNSGNQLNISTNANGGIIVTSSNTSGPGITMDASGQSGHKYAFFATASANTPGYFGVYDATANETPFAVLGNGTGNANRVQTSALGQFGWTNGTLTNTAVGSCDTGLERAGAGIVQISDCSSGTGSLKGFLGNFTGGVTAAILEYTVGTSVASATTIAPTNGIQHVSGTTAIVTITPPGGMSSTVGGCIILIADGAWTTTTAGNIQAVMTAVPNTQYNACYDGAKWFIK